MQSFCRPLDIVTFGESNPFFDECKKRKSKPGKHNKVAKKTLTKPTYKLKISFRKQARRGCDYRMHNSTLYTHDICGHKGVKHKYL